ncbi:MAG: CehA/McbA family metallohydrolase [Myxococcota bacterium]
MNFRRLLAPCLVLPLLAACDDGGGAVDDRDADVDTAPEDAHAVDGETDLGPPIPSCPAPPPSADEVRARRIECPEEAPTGHLAAALPGDVVLENARARFVVRDRVEGHALHGLTGGHVVDAVALAPDGSQVGDDALRELAVTAELWLLRPDAVEILDDGPDGVARVEVRGELAPFPLIHEVFELDAPRVRMRHVYTLAPDSPILRIETHLEPTAEGSEVVMTGDFSLWGGAVRLWVPGRGQSGAMSGEADLVGLAPVVAEPLAPAYAISTETPRTSIDAAGIKALVWSGLDVPPEGAVAVRHLAVSSRPGDLAGAMAAASGAVGRPLATVSGEVEAAWPGVLVEARDDDDAPLTRCPLDAEGRFECEVPPETSRLAAIWLGDGNGRPAGPGHAVDGDGAVAEVDPASGSATADLVAAAAPRVDLSVTDPADQPVAFRLTARADDGRRHSFVDADGTASFRLPPGGWDVWVHRGPAWSEHRDRLELSPGDVATLDVVLDQVVDTTDWMACDLHVHAEQSTDSEALDTHRVVSAVADGLDVLVATDHDFVSDYGPALAEAGLPEDALQVAAGAEVSTATLGHFNVWPLEIDPERAGHGTPDWAGLEASELLDLLDAATPGGVVQVNHPRFSGAAYFDAVDFDPEAMSPDLLRFDAMELVNGIGHSDTPEVLDDWSRLLDRGIRRTGTATSDTHGVDDSLGSPRTLVQLGDGDTVWDALRAGRVVATGGPMLTIELVDAEGRRAGMGDTITQPEAPLTARVVLEAPDWIPLGRVEVRSHDGLLLDEDVSAVAAEDGARRIEHTVELPADEDAWVFAVHVPDGTPEAGLRRPPWAIANPAFVDADGDGDWTPAP